MRYTYNDVRYHTKIRNDTFNFKSGSFFETGAVNTLTVNAYKCNSKTFNN